MPGVDPPLAGDDPLVSTEPLLHAVAPASAMAPTQESALIVVVLRCVEEAPLAGAALCDGRAEVRDDGGPRGDELSTLSLLLSRRALPPATLGAPGRRERTCASLRRERMCARGAGYAPRGLTRRSAVSMGEPPGPAADPGIAAPESRSTTACLKPTSSARALNATPSGVWREMPSKSVARSCVEARPMLSYAWLIISFCIMSWFLGMLAGRATSRSTSASSSAAGTDCETRPIRAASSPVIRSPVRRSRLARSAPTR